jgi:uncharacterized membrane protein
MALILGFVQASGLAAAAIFLPELMILAVSAVLLIVLGINLMLLGLILRRACGMAIDSWRKLREREIRSRANAFPEAHGQTSKV